MANENIKSYKYQTSDEANIPIRVIPSKREEQQPIKLSFQGTWVQYTKGGAVPHLFPPKFDFTGNLTEMGKMSLSWAKALCIIVL